MDSPRDPYGFTDTPIVGVNVGGAIQSGQLVGGRDLPGVLGYSYTSDILTLTDTATIDVANPDGNLSGAINKGTRLVLTMADPNVNGGARTVQLSGLVVNPRMTSRGGEKIQIEAADQGWYLEQCDAPLWYNLETAHTLGDFLNRMMRGRNGEDYGWGFYDDFGNLKVLGTADLDKGLRQGRQGVNRDNEVRVLQSDSAQMVGSAYVLPLQVGPGTKVGQLIIDYARRSKLLANVSPLGYLLLFRPNYSQQAAYSVEYHADERRGRNNALNITISDSCEGVVSESTCVSQKAWNKEKPTVVNPNVDKNRATYPPRPVNGRALASIPHFLRKVFGDEDQVNATMVANRAKWGFLRAQFDAFSIEVELYGHSQNGLFFVPDTMWSVNDTVHGFVGNYYCSACRYQRQAGGTRTIVTLRKPNLLAA